MVKVYGQDEKQWGVMRTEMRNLKRRLRSAAMRIPPYRRRYQEAKGQEKRVNGSIRELRVFSLNCGERRF
jgi:hypothetical protein